MDVRADVFLYLLHSAGGNSLAVAREITSDQRSVYHALERWLAAGVVFKSDRNYALAGKDDWQRLLGLSGTTGYINWVRTLVLLGRLTLVAESSIGNDEYLMSSFFRDLTPEADGVARSVGVALPDESEYTGAGYFGPFAEAALKMAESL